MGAMNLLQCAMPLSFAYAIVRHQVIPVKLIIRRGLQYLLAKNALRLAVALPAVGLALSIISNRDRPLSEILFGGSLYFYFFIAAVALALVFRKRLGVWVDRKFFRESYNQEKILRELTDDVKKLDSIPEMSRRVTERVTAALHPAQTFLFYREEGTRDLSLTYTSGGRDAARELKIPEEFRLLRFMEDQGSAQEFPFPQKNGLPQDEKAWLASLGPRLIVPLAGTDDRPAGLLLLGEKKSEVPYTAGVVHRDLKPENVLLSASETKDARVRLLDFCLAKFTQALPADSLSPAAAASAPMTTPGAVMGTFGYMSPEQLTGGAVDERSDLFSVGVMIVEAITGRRPFAGTTYHELLTNVLNAPYHLEGDSPAARQLDSALQRALAKDPAARYAAAAAMRQELIPALRQCPPPGSREPAALDAETFILNR
ncbi:MAG: protein kinase [Acidobacteria bacterium]|nr:protein kinase [Acidobacteriota bacterium]